MGMVVRLLEITNDPKLVDLELMSITDQTPLDIRIRLHRIYSADVMYPSADFNNSKRKVFDKFTSMGFGRKYFGDEINYEKTIESLGYNQTQVFIDPCSYDYIIRSSNTVLDLDLDQYVCDKIDMGTGITFEVLEEFKGRYKEGFWEWSQLDDFLPTSKEYLLKEDLEQAKQYFLWDSPIQQWELKENQVIHLSW